MTSPIRRIVTGHDDRGKAVVLFDGPAGNVTHRKIGGFVSTVLWAVDETPADVSQRVDRADREVALGPLPNAAVFRIVDFPPAQADAPQRTSMAQEMGAGVYDPGGTAPAHPFMHRTRSIDYVLIMSGEIDMLLDDGVAVHVKAGDVVVQQATNHAWVNRGTEACRIAFIMIDAREPPAWAE
jgi:uncharacterized cupin superfamily protein